jgi:hypothetical protein
LNLNTKEYTREKVNWLLTYGEWPAGPLYHRNSDPLDDRPANLTLRVPPRPAKLDASHPNGRDAAKPKIARRSAVPSCKHAVARRMTNQRIATLKRAIRTSMVAAMKSVRKLDEFVDRVEKALAAFERKQEARRQETMAGRSEFYSDMPRTYTDPEVRDWRSRLSETLAELNGFAARQIGCRRMLRS